MSEFVPVTELGEGSQDSQIRWNFTLQPSIDAERISINLDRLHRLHRIGGIAASVVFDYQGDRSEYTPGISGINSDGTAIASKTGTAHKAEETKTNTFDLFPPNLERQFGKVAVAHGINKAELASTISDKVRKNGGEREKLWASQLDQALRHSLRDAGKENLIRRNPFYVRLLDSMWVGGGTGMLANQILTQHPNPLFVIYPAVWSFGLGMQMRSNRRLFGESLIQNRRWSLVPDSFQPDRYVAMSALSRVPGLIKARE